MGRILILVGLTLIAAGALVLGLNRLGLPLGRLPGDLAFRGKNVSVFAPLGTSLLISLLLSLLFYVLSNLRR